MKCLDCGESKFRVLKLICTDVGPLMVKECTKCGSYFLELDKRVDVSACEAWVYLQSFVAQMNRDMMDGEDEN